MEESKSRRRALFPPPVKRRRKKLISATDSDDAPDDKDGGVRGACRDRATIVFILEGKRDARDRFRALSISRAPIRRLLYIPILLIPPPLSRAWAQTFRTVSFGFRNFPRRFPSISIDTPPGGAARGGNSPDCAIWAAAR